MDRNLTSLKKMRMYILEEVENTGYMKKKSGGGPGVWVLEKS